MIGLRVERAGALTTVQDLGRAGLAYLGVPRSGAADVPSHRRANTLVGNDPAAATLEIAATGATVRALVDVVVAVTGADAPAWVGSVPAPTGAPLRLRAGQVLEIGAPDRGWRSYLAVRGGVDADPVLGSRSTDLLSGLGPPPLSDGAEVRVGAAPPLSDSAFGVLRASAIRTRVEPLAQTTRLALTWGPRADWFTDAARAALVAGSYVASGDANRVGLRLEGPSLERARAGELESEATVLGAVQVPRSGQPVVFLADHPVTGGYPVIGVVNAAGVAAAAQVRPGDTVRFHEYEHPARV